MLDARCSMLGVCTHSPQGGREAEVAEVRSVSGGQGAGAALECRIPPEQDPPSFLFRLKLLSNEHRARCMPGGHHVPRGFGCQLSMEPPHLSGHPGEACAVMRGELCTACSTQRPAPLHISAPCPALPYDEEQNLSAASASPRCVRPRVQATSVPACVPLRAFPHPRASLPRP